MILSFPNHTGLEPGFKIIFSHPVPSSEGGDWTRALQAELTLLQAGKALASCHRPGLVAGFNLDEISQLAFAPIPVKRASCSGAGGGCVDNLFLSGIPF